MGANDWERAVADDFSLDSHRKIFGRMRGLAESSRPIDMITLVEELERHKELLSVGDVGYVSSLVEGVPDRPSVEHYVEMCARRLTATPQRRTLC
jgi:replicative DNA helicase